MNLLDIVFTVKSVKTKPEFNEILLLTKITLVPSKKEYNVIRIKTSAALAEIAISLQRDIFLSIAISPKQYLLYYSF